MFPLSIVIGNGKFGTSWTPISGWSAPRTLIGAIETVHAYLRDVAADGVAVLLLSEDLDEILLLADRIAVMYEGAIVGETSRADASVEEIGLLMAGGES